MRDVSALRGLITQSDLGNPLLSCPIWRAVLAALWPRFGLAGFAVETGMNREDSQELADADPDALWRLSYGCRDRDRSRPRNGRPKA